VLKISQIHSDIINLKMQSTNSNFQSEDLSNITNDDDLETCQDLGKFLMNFLGLYNYY